MDGGASPGLAWDGGVFVDFGWWRGGGGVVLAFAENAFEGGAGEPDKVGTGVHVE